MIDRQKRFVGILNDVKRRKTAVMVIFETGVALTGTVHQVEAQSGYVTFNGLELFVGKHKIQSTTPGRTVDHFFVDDIICLRCLRTSKRK